MAPRSHYNERERLELLAIQGKLDIIARRNLKPCKTYTDYKNESVATNARLLAKYGASPGTKIPMQRDYNSSI